MDSSEPELTTEAHVATDPEWAADFAANLPGALRRAEKIALIHVPGYSGAMAWCDVGIIAGVHSDSPEARLVERHLGSGPCLYYYAGRCHPKRGGVAFARSVSTDDGATGWASPFDTGGIFRHIHFVTERNEAERLELLSRLCRIPLSKWRISFGHFLAAYFESADGYAAYWSARPKRDDAHGILAHPRNTWQAWTYEVRYESGGGAFISVSNVSRWCGTEAVVKELQSRFVKRFGADHSTYKQVMSKCLAREGTARYAKEIERWAKEDKP